MRKFRLYLNGRLLLFAACCLALAVGGVLLSVWLPRALAPIAAAERLFSLSAAILVVCGRAPAEHKISQLALLILLPWMGAILCFLFKNRAPSANFRGTVSENPPSRFSYGAISSALCDLPETSVTSAEYFPVGRDMYGRLLTDLKGAKRSIWLEYYIIGEGVFWGSLLPILTEKARSGAEVLVIVDGFGSARTLPKRFERDLRRRGIGVTVFRPLRFPSRGTGRRDHRKILVVDGEIAYTGGLNIADEYIGERVRFGHWKDTAVRVTGESARAFAALFARTWNAAEPKRPIEAPAVRAQTGGSCAVVADDAREREIRAGRMMFLRLFADAKERLYINTPYLAPDGALLCALKNAALSGVDVRLMIPHIPDKKLPFYVTRSYAAELACAGVQVREYTDGFLHAKSVLSDGNAYVGSYNLDLRSLFLQAECGIVVKDLLSDALSADFLAAWESGTPLPAFSRGRIFFGKLARLIAPLL